MRRFALALFILLLALGDGLFLPGISPLFLLSTTLSAFLGAFCLRRAKFWLAILLALHLPLWLFGSYFGRAPTMIDLYLFFGHADETFEGLVGMGRLFLPAAAWAVLGALVLGWTTSVKPRCSPKLRLVVAIAVLALAWPWQSSPTESESSRTHRELRTPSLPVRSPDMSVVFVVGESMACDESILHRFRGLGGCAHCIVASATNTDVSLPLLFNGLDDPRSLIENDPKNLFALAKKNRFFTRFASAQSAHNLRYVFPYLGREWIDDYSDTPREKRAPHFDMILLKKVENLPDRSAFIVLHQLGQHAPYTFYSGEKEDDFQENYARSLDYSFAFYRRLIESLEKRRRPYVLIVTSDHGEFRGRKGRWGHNTFAPEVYRVPLFVRFGGGEDSDVDTVHSHGDLYRYIRFLLGYDDRFEPQKPPYVVNGTMLDRQDGFIRVNGE